jgi:hypothetical protein
LVRNRQMGESARTSIYRQFIVDLSKIAEGSFSAVVEPSLETVEFSMLHSRE